MNEEIKEEIVLESESVVVADPGIGQVVVAQKMPLDQLKLWKGISVVLALVMVGLIVKPIAKVDQTAKDPNVVGQSFIDTVNKVYAPSVTNAVLGSVEDQHGMYLVKFKVDLDGSTMDQETFVTKDGEYIVPQAIAIADIVAQFEASQALEAATVPADGTEPTTDTTAIDQPAE